MFPNSAFKGKLEKATLVKKAGSTFLKGKRTEALANPVDIQIVTMPISAGQVLKNDPRADTTLERISFHQYAALTTSVIIEVGDLMTVENGKTYAVESVKDWRRHGNYLKGIAVVERKPGPLPEIPV